MSMPIARNSAQEDLRIRPVGPSPPAELPWVKLEQTASSGGYLGAVFSLDGAFLHTFSSSVMHKR